MKILICDDKPENLPSLRKALIDAHHVLEFFDARKPIQGTNERAFEDDVVKCADLIEELITVNSCEGMIMDLNWYGHSEQGDFGVRLLRELKKPSRFLGSGFRIVVYSRFAVENRDELINIGIPEDDIVPRWGGAESIDKVVARFR